MADLRYAEHEAALMTDSTPVGRILVVEDDPEIAGRLTRGLRAAGFEVELAVRGPQASALDPSGFDVVVLDLNLPELDGFEILEQWRSRSSTPVIVLTANLDLGSRLRTFELGAVDYMPKPFFMEELLARIQARLGRRDAPNAVISLRDAELDLDARVVRLHGEDAGLTAVEFNVLACLVERRGRALSRRQLADLALPADREQADRVVDSHIARIRKKLGAAGEVIVTVWGIGYRCEA